MRQLNMTKGRGNPSKQSQNKCGIISFCNGAAIWLILLLLPLAAASAKTKVVKERANWLARELQSHFELQAAIDTNVKEHISVELSNQRHRLKEVDSEVSVTGQSLPQRVRIAPFDLLLAPTPIQLQRADEDLLLVDLQELLVLFMKTQFNSAGSVTNRMGTDTKLEYVLFSDIIENSWNAGKKNRDDPPRTVLRFNGGIASFVGPDIPLEEDVNDWTVQAVNELFAAALADTPYNYIGIAQYICIEDQNSAIDSGAIDISFPSKVTTSGQSLQQNAMRPPADREYAGENSSLFHALVSVLVAFSIIAVALAIFIRRNNRAVRVICFSNKEGEEIVDFSDNEPITITHDSTKGDTANERELVSMKSNNQNSMGTTCTGAIDECSQGSISEYTIPTVSALSFRNPNPFAQGLVAQESFQKERKTHLSKDMLYSSWSAKPPNLESFGKNHDDSVLQPSYFSAAKEWERLAKGAPPPRLDSLEEQNELEEGNFEGRRLPLEPPARRADLNDEKDGIFRLSLTS